MVIHQRRGAVPESFGGRYQRGYAGPVKTAVSLPDPLFRAAERLAKRLGVTRSRLYSRALERYVGEAEESDATARLNRIYAHESARLAPMLEALQELSIPHEDW